MKLYIVQGETGEYSDRRNWLVQAFKDEEKAKDFILRADERARVLLSEYDNYFDIPYGVNELDPQMQTDYTGTRYFYEAVELSDES